MPSYWFGDVLAVVFHIRKMFAETISQPSSCFADVKLVTEDRIPLTITYYPNNLRVKDIILKNFKLLQSDPDTATIFEKPPLVSFKRDKNLRNSLVKGSLSTELEPGTFKCSRKRCNTCPYITNTVSISGPKNSTQITDHFDCTSRNVIYCIRCTACGSD